MHFCLIDYFGPSDVFRPSVFKEGGIQQHPAKVLPKVDFPPRVDLAFGLWNKQELNGGCMLKISLEYSVWAVFIGWQWIVKWDTQNLSVHEGVMLICIINCWCKLVFMKSHSSYPTPAQWSPWEWACTCVAKVKMVGQKLSLCYKCRHVVQSCNNNLYLL